MSASPDWTRQQLLVAFHLYTQLPFWKLHSRNPEIVKYAALSEAAACRSCSGISPQAKRSGRMGWMLFASIAKREGCAARGCGMSHKKFARRHST